jgi:hypothetical protein
MLSRWPSFPRFLQDGRVCLTNNAAERAIRPLAVGAAIGPSPALMWAADRRGHVHTD